MQRYGVLDSSEDETASYCITEDFCTTWQSPAFLLSRSDTAAKSFLRSMLFENARFVAGDQCNPCFGSCCIVLSRMPVRGEGAWYRYEIESIVHNQNGQCIIINAPFVWYPFPCINSSAASLRSLGTTDSSSSTCSAASWALFESQSISPYVFDNGPAVAEDPQPPEPGGREPGAVRMMILCCKKVV